MSAVLRRSWIPVNKPGLNQAILPLHIAVHQAVDSPLAAQRIQSFMKRGVTLDELQKAGVTCAKRPKEFGPHFVKRKYPRNHFGEQGPILAFHDPGAEPAMITSEQFA